MFGIGLPEFLLILAVGIVVISPDDIPHALHTMGKFFNKFKGITRDMQRSIDEVMAVEELEEITREANKAGSININMEDLERQQTELQPKNVLDEYKDVANDALNKNIESKDNVEPDIKDNVRLEKIA